MKLLADILHGILKEWGISANSDDSPSTWQGVTCAANGVDILQLNLQRNSILKPRLRGNFRELLYNPNFNLL